MSEQDNTPIKDEVAEDLPEAEQQQEPTAETPADSDAVDHQVEDQPAAPAADDKQPAVGSTQDTVLEVVKAEARKNLEGWQRTLAEFQNYKRRVEREQRDAKTKVALDTLIKILPIIDDFERAMASVPEEHADTPWVNGVNLINGKFKRLLEDYDVTIVDPLGEPFDPNLHQAISMDDSDEYESGHVIETLQKGYQSGDILLRPAIVRVAN